MQVLLICVNYFNDRETLRFVKTLLSRTDSDCLKVVVVDNSGTLEPQEFDPGSDRCVLLSPGTNLGYFGGANWALRKYSSLHAGNPDFVIVCNTDVGICQGDFFTRLCGLPRLDDVAIIAPSIISARSGLDQNPYMMRKPSRMLATVRALAFKSTVLFAAYQLLSQVKRYIKARALKTRKPVEAIKPIYAPHGSFVVFCKKYFEMGGSLAHPLFLYGEEVFLARKVEKLGLRILYVPSLRVVHYEHSTTRRMGLRARAQHAARAADYVLRVLVADTE